MLSPTSRHWPWWGDGTDGCSHVFSNAVRKNTAHGWRLVGGLRRSVATGRGQHAPLPLPVATGRWQHAPPTTASGSSVDRVSDVFSNAVRKNTVTRWYHGGLNGFRVFPKFRWHEDGVQGLPKVVMFFLPLFERTRLQDGITVVSWGFRGLPKVIFPDVSFGKQW